MLKNKLLLLTAITSVIAISCTKESFVTNTAAPSPENALVKTKTIGNKVETYIYDSQNRISRIVFSDNGNSYYYEYTYLNDAVLEYHSNEPRHEMEETMPNGSVKTLCTSNPRKLKLDANGYYRGHSSLCETQSFHYDLNGFIKEQQITFTDYRRTDQILNDGKNISNIYSTGYSYGGAEFAYETIIQYSKIKSSTGNVNFGKSFLGKSSEHLVTSIKENGNTTSYIYELDAQQRVINSTTLNNKEEVVTTYTYY